MATRFETAILDEKDHAAWDALAAAAPGGTIFHRADWARLLAEPFGRQARILGVLRNGSLVGGCPLYERRVLGLTVADPPVLGGYAGALVGLPESKREGRAVSETEQVLEALEAAVRRRAAHTRLVQAPGLIDSRAFGWSGWRVVPRFTYRVALAGTEPDAILSAFEHNARKKVRKALDAGLTVHRVDALDEVLATYDAAYRRHGTPPPVSEPVLRAVAERVLAAGFGRAYVVREPNGESHAFQMLLMDGRLAYFWFAGSDPEHLRDGGFSLLTWKVMADVAASVGEIDFMGANTPPIAAFKRAFGGTLVPYWEAVWATLPARVLLGARLILASRRS